MLSASATACRSLTIEPRSDQDRVMRDPASSMSWSDSRTGTDLEFRLVGRWQAEPEPEIDGWRCPAEDAEHWEKRRNELADGSAEIECGYCGIVSCDRGDPCEIGPFFVIHHLDNHPRRS
jgi:hypothetical protein